jgi:hypothetical protein
MATRITYQAGTVVLDKRTKAWYFRWRDADGRRRAYRIGTLKQYNTAEEASQCRAVCRMRCDINQKAEPALEIVTVSEVRMVIQ